MQNSVTATGTIEAVTSVTVGTQVSGIVNKLYVDYNSQVKKVKLSGEEARRVLAAGVPADMQNGEIEVSLYDQIWQAGTVLLSTVRSVGVMGDERTYEHPVALRAVTSTDAMTADWAHLPYDFMAKVSNEIINKVKGVNRVCYDISSKPPSTIEWE